MCLRKVDKETIIIKYAYKVFEIDEKGNLQPLYFSYTFPKRRWIIDDNDDTVSDYPFYKCGFHSYVNKEDAMRKKLSTCTCTWHNKRVVHRVIVKDIIASGIQPPHKSKAIVSRQIYIMEEVF